MSERPLLDLLDEPFFLLDESDTLSEWNEALPTVTGYTAEALAGSPPSSVLDAEDSTLSAAIATALDTGESRLETGLRTATGASLPYEVTFRRVEGAAGAVAGICRDRSEQLQYRRQLANRERVLSEMYDIIADRNMGFDEQVEALLRLGREELDVAYGTLSRIEGENYHFEVVDAVDDTIQAGDTAPVSATNCEIAASTERTLVLGDIERDAPDQTHRAGYTEWGIACYIGAPVFVRGEVYGTFCFYDTTPRNGQFSAWEVTLVDLMSRWVGSELDRQQDTEQLRRQNDRLEGFASIVSHDLRNPLNALEGWLELAEETGDPEHFERAERAIDRMRVLIDDLLTLARAGEAIDDLAPVALAAVAEAAWATVPTEDATIRLETTRTVEADDPRLQQLFENLFRNSTDHGGDTVTVTVGDLEDGFFVADDGPGIPEDAREQVFEDGYTTAADGTGIGLAIVRSIAEAHGWDVRLTASEAGGARFEFTW
ncbi:ATP-binding protein [Natronomonas sp. EA1]|uniref:sensor histidine kinase n=1 Tax=Natronomonas sp. EA1 TaxID=3421655 RepID=UPI003EBF5298